MSELGNRLKEAREAKGLTLEELQEITKIQVRYLVGIEEGNYSMMPGKFYTRAFIKQYAEAVDLVPEEIFEEYKGEVPTTVNDELPQNLSRVNSRSAIDGATSKVFDILPTILIAILVLAVAFLVWYFVYAKDSNPEKQSSSDTEPNSVYMKSDALNKKEKEKAIDEDANKEEEQVVEEEEKKVEEEAPKQEITKKETAGRTTTYEVKNAEKFVVKLVATGKVWVDIQNGKNYSFFQGILEKGGAESHEEDLSKETEARIVIGNSQVDVFVNDEKLELGDSSSRQDLVIKNIKEE
ncbi:helix-turn-helix domain-containing protein [Niallia circulans]|uniref:helix-turn-helix domain-containing protein n=1 Tax=Niallia circulans TaxID=1397 RepID=UPI001561ACBF|nr:RodZ domain-containing protein [Niallia circulans]NRG34737.1 helix-turn-helix domain-containing protein [Niallia circulans]